MLRAIRFSARLGFKIEENTGKAIIEKALKINEVSAERIREELVKIFTGKNRSLGLQLLHDYKILPHILPEVEAMVGVEQNPEFHPEGDVFTHTKLTLDYIGDGPSTVLALSALLHDVGKPLCYEIKETAMFPKHSHIGAQMADNILKRLKFPNDQREKIVFYIKEHMRFADMPKMREGKLKKMLQRESIMEELELHVADCLACHGNLDVRDFCLKKLKEYKEQAG